MFLFFFPSFGAALLVQCVGSNPFEMSISMTIVIVIITVPRFCTRRAADRQIIAVMDYQRTLGVSIIIYEISPFGRPVPEAWCPGTLHLANLPCQYGHYSRPSSPPPRPPCIKLLTCSRYFSVFLCRPLFSEIRMEEELLLSSAAGQRENKLPQT